MLRSVLDLGTVLAAPAAAMPTTTVEGVFENPAAAERAMDRLLEAGVGRHRIVGKLPEPQAADPYRSQACLLRVAARSPVDGEQIARLMRESGARETRDMKSGDVQ
jgi:hypothetical protein